MGDELHAVADAEHRNARAQRIGIDLRRVRVVDARRSAAQDQPRRMALLELCPRRRPRHELAVDVGLADAARDQLAELGAEVEHEDGLQPRAVLKLFPPNRGVPIITASAPDAKALQTSAPIRIPPSVMTATRTPPRRMYSSRAAATSAVAVTCGTPTPSTPRVVHAAPGPTPTRMPAMPVSISSNAVSYCTQLPTTTGISHARTSSSKASW